MQDPHAPSAGPAGHPGELSLAQGKGGERGDGRAQPPAGDEEEKGTNVEAVQPPVMICHRRSVVRGGIEKVCKGEG